MLLLLGEFLRLCSLGHTKIVDPENSPLPLRERGRLSVSRRRNQCSKEFRNGFYIEFVSFWERYCTGPAKTFGDAVRLISIKVQERFLRTPFFAAHRRSEEHTSELQS